MKRTTRCLVLALVTIMTVCLTTIPAFASTNLENKAEKAEKALVNAAEYYGWTAEEIGSALERQYRNAAHNGKRVHI